MNYVGGLMLIGLFMLVVYISNDISTYRLELIWWSSVASVLEK